MYLSGVASARQPTGGAALSDRIDSQVRAMLALRHTAGAAIEIVQTGKVVYVGAFGVRDLAHRLPVDATSEFEIGSITKQVTAAAILQLQQAGKLNIDDPLATYIPNAPHAREVTLRELLAHTSGMPEYFTSCANASKPITFEGIMALIAGKPLDFAPGSRWRYSDTGYILLGRVIEVVAGESYNRYVRTHELDKADMTQTYTVADEPRLPDMTIGYDSSSGVEQLAPIMSESYGWAAGNLVSDVGDLQKWDASLAGGRIVSEQSYQLMRANATTSDGANTDYGFGFFVDTLEGQTRIGHTGHSCGFAAEDEYFPLQDTRITVLTNDVNGPAEAIVTILLNDLFPTVAATAKQPAPDEDLAITARVKAAITPLLGGHVVRSQFTDDELRELTDETLRTQFLIYGAPTAFVFKQKIDRHFGPVYVYWVAFGDDVERLILQVERATDKINAVEFSSAAELGAKR